MAEYPYLSTVLNYHNGQKYNVILIKGKYKPFYVLIGSMDFLEKCRQCLLYNTETEVEKFHEIIDHVWFPGYIQLESGNAISMDLIKRLDEKLDSIINDPLLKVRLYDIYDAIMNNVFYYPENNMLDVHTPFIHPAFVLSNLTNEEQQKFKHLHQQIRVNSFINTLMDNYPKHRYTS